MVLNTTDNSYSYTFTALPTLSYGTYHVEADGINGASEPVKVVAESFIIGMFLYVSILDVLNSQVGIDRTQFDQSVIEQMIIVAQELLSNYIGMTF
jgi:RsiW-degrading membrane proteinase PrsW (M82 family)